MPPSNCLASSSRNSHSSRNFKKAFTAAGLSRFCTSLLDRSAGCRQAMPAGNWLSIATAISPPSQGSPYMEYYTSISEFSRYWLLKVIVAMPLKKFARWPHSSFLDGYLHPHPQEPRYRVISHKPRHPVPPPRLCLSP